MSSAEPYISLARNPAIFSEGPGILMYHKVARAPWATYLPALYVDPDAFRAQMQELASSGLPCLTCGEVAAAAQRRAPGFCLTFDDGFRNVFAHALPILREYRLRAIQFLVAGRIGGQDTWDQAAGEPSRELMNEQEVQEWVASGQEIGAHTVTHPRLTRLDPTRARAEICESKKVLEDRFNQPIRYFCYPYGDYNQQVRDWVGEAGYEAAVTVEPGVNRPEDDPLRLRRFMACQQSRGPRALAGKVVRAWRRRFAR